MNHGVTEGAGSRVDGVVVVGVCYDVVPSVAAADGVAAESDGAVG